MEHNAGFAMESAFSDEAWGRYLSKEEPVSNKRLRADSEDFLDALLSVDMAATPERREILEAIGRLS